MLFKSEDTSLRLEIPGYEFNEFDGEPGTDDRNWLMMRATYVNEDGEISKDSNSCLLTYELREMTAGLKVLNAGIKENYISSFMEPYFELGAKVQDDGFGVAVSFYLPNSLDGNDSAYVECKLTKEEMNDLISELDLLCTKFPDRT